MRYTETAKPWPLEVYDSQGLSFLRSPLLCDLPGLEHAFMKRTGGVSPAPYDTMNFGGEDNASNIAENIKRLSKVFSLPGGTVFTIEQVHGSSVVVIGDDYDVGLDGRGGRPQGDAIVTSKKNLAIGILTADCVPVLFYDKKTETIAAAHAGWRGFAAGVLGETISVMRRGFGAKTANIIVAIGPHIGPCCYEVSEDLLARFQEKDMGGRPYFRKEAKGLYLDLGRAVYDELIASGLGDGHISLPGPCTACDRKGFYSYRRDGATGRQLSFIFCR